MISCLANCLPFDSTTIPFITGEKDASQGRKYSFSVRIEANSKGSRTITKTTKGPFISLITLKKSELLYAWVTQSRIDSHEFVLFT